MEREVAMILTPNRIYRAGGHVPHSDGVRVDAIRAHEPSKDFPFYSFELLKGGAVVGYIKPEQVEAVIFADDLLTIDLNKTEGGKDLPFTDAAVVH